MDKISPENWENFSEAIRRRWPTISKDELEGTEGFINQVEFLIENKTIEPVKDLKKALKKIYQESITRH